MYLKWCERHRKFHPVDSVTFGRDMHRLGLKSKRGPEVPGSHGKKVRPWTYVFPPLERARQVMAEQYALPEALWSGDDAGPVQDV